jgi:hypothetical protein
MRKLFYTKFINSTHAIPSLSSYPDINEDDESNYHGGVKNNCPTNSMNNIKIIATFDNSAGEIIGTDFTYTNEPY